MVLERLKASIRYFYLQYTLVTSLYMLEPTERRTFNSLLLAVIAMCVYTGCTVLPGHVRLLFQTLAYYTYGMEGFGQIIKTE